MEASTTAATRVTRAFHSIRISITGLVDPLPGRFEAALTCRPVSKNSSSAFRTTTSGTSVGRQGAHMTAVVVQHGVGQTLRQHHPGVAMLWAGGSKIELDNLW